ncbi:DUF748 domain-containing protein [Ferrimonas balearica]|uniref:DUF748 domain-containing protein n=1 Tax=Ferrimonas balearica TaxID=44012 RepID=UPI001C993A81|nr:DUF748 domain-containing protein [Ferrimonas balearica]MBY5920709.1 DUF748 domain-containing protein [Ferrimonas balearica]MBY5996606.1 DUF748 domain-containing protein [Ferrimonas balearica]
MKLATLWQRRPVRIGVYATAAFAGYLALLGWGLPALIERQAPKWVSQEMAANLSLGEVRFHPLEWRLSVSDLLLTGEDGKPLTGFSQFEVDLEPWRSLFNRHWQLHRLTLADPLLEYRQLGADNNWQQALAPLLNAPAEPEPAGKPKSGLPKLAIDFLAITGGKVRYEQDQSHATELTDLALQAEDFHLSRGDNRVALSLSGPGGGKADVELSATFDPLDVTVALDLKHADLTRYWPYLAQDFRFDLARAKLDANLQAHVSLAPQLQFTLSQSDITLRGLDLTDKDRSFIALQQARLAPIDFDLAKQTVKLGALELNGLDLKANLTEEGMDLATLLTPISAESDTPSEGAAEGSAPAWSVSLDSVLLEEGLLEFTDQTLEQAATWVVNIAPLKVGPLGTDLTRPLTVDLDAQINEQAVVTVDGDWRLDQSAGQFDLVVDDFDLLSTIPYWQPMVDLTLASGSFSTHGAVKVALGEPLSLSYDGSVDIAQLVTQDTAAERDFVKWGQLNINRIEFDLANRRLAIDQLAFDEPYARVIIDEDGSTNFAGLVASEEAPAGDETGASGDTSEPQAPFDITIGRVLFSNGSAFFADNTLTPKFATGIETLTGEIAGLDAQTDSRATVDIEGQVDRYAPVSLKGTVQPLAAEPFMDLALNFDNVELTSLNPYSGTYAGYFIDQGQLDLSLKYALESNQLKGENQVVISQLKLGQRSDSDKATTLPVALAVALLQDSNGVIDLGLEVSGNLDDPEFAIGPLILKALGNVITKIVTSPFSLLGSLLGGEDPPDHVQFAAGETVISDDSQAQLARLVEALAQRPSLVLSAQGAVDPVADSKALAKVRVDARLMPEGSGLTEPPELVLAAAYDAVKGMGRAQAEEEALKARLPDLDEAERQRRWKKGLYEQLLEAEPVDELALKTLASERGEAVKGALVDAGLDPKRVFLKESRINLDQSGAKVVLELDAAG